MNIWKVQVPNHSSVFKVTLTESIGEHYDNDTGCKPTNISVTEPEVITSLLSQDV